MRPLFHDTITPPSVAAAYMLIFNETVSILLFYCPTFVRAECRCFIQYKTGWVQMCQEQGRIPTILLSSTIPIKQI